MIFALLKKYFLSVKRNTSFKWWCYMHVNVSLWALHKTIKYMGTDIWTTNKLFNSFLIAPFDYFTTIVILLRSWCGFWFKISTEHLKKNKIYKRNWNYYNKMNQRLIVAGGNIRDSKRRGVWVKPWFLSIGSREEEEDTKMSYSRCLSVLCFLFVILGQLPNGTLAPWSFT